MAQFSFDYFDQFDLPNIALANPDLTLLYSLGNIHDRKLNLRFNALSEFSFVADEFQNDEYNQYFEYLDYRRVVRVDGIGNFMIVQKRDDNDGVVRTRSITCQSLEVEMSFAKLSLFKGTFKFWDTTNPSPTILGTLLQYLPDWSVIYVDSSLWGVYRTFDVSDTNIYNFLMNDVSKAYQCVFVFDTFNRTISAYDLEHATTDTDIFLSYNNLVEKVVIEQVTEEMVTALNVFGGGDLDIRTVNPLGTNTIYNFDYYKNTTWMSQGLIDAINTWESLIDTYQPQYSNLLTERKNKNAQLLVLNGELNLLYDAPYPDGLDSLKEVQTVRIREGTPGPIEEINALVKAKESEITAKNSEIALLETSIKATNDALVVINNALSWENNFADAQLTELHRFIVGSTYTNENIIKTDISTNVEIQEYSQDLYDQGVAVLARISEPRYMFTVDSANFIFLKEFETFVDQVQLGSVVTVEFQEGIFAYPALLGIDLDYDNPTNFKIIFSNRLRLDDSAFQFSDLYNQQVNAGIKSSFNSEQWSSWTNYSKDQVSEFITSALDASANAVINSSNQEIVIDGTGIRGRHLVGESYDPEQFWMMNNLLAFTRDNWDHASLALGKIQTPTGGSAYGLAAEVLLGRLVASNELLVTNETSTFNVSGSRASFVNAEVTLYNENNTSQILLNPYAGIEISKKNDFGNFEKKFYTDTDGNVIFSGSLSAASGTFEGEITAKLGKIGAWKIDDLGLYDTYGNYIYGDGRVRLGMLTIEGSNATFNGNIYAANLVDKVQAPQIETVAAESIMAGTIFGVKIYGGEILWPGVRMYSPHAGFSFIECSSFLGLVSEDNIIDITPEYIQLFSDKEIFIGRDAYSTNIILRAGLLSINGQIGVSGIFVI